MSCHTDVFTILLWNQTFVSLWIGEEYYAGHFTTLVILIMAVQYAFLRHDGNIIDLTLNLRFKVFLGLLSALISLAAAAIAVGPLRGGIAGLCIGFIVGRLLLTVAYPLIAGSHLKVRPFDQLRDVLRPAAVSAVLFLVGAAGAEYAGSLKGYALVLCCVATPVVAALGAYGVGASANQQVVVRERVKKLLRPTRRARCDNEDSNKRR